MRITRIKLDKEKLLEIPETERIFFIALGHSINEVNAIAKMLYWAANAPESCEVEEHGKFSLLLLFITILSGKLNESWELLKKHFFGTGLSKVLEPQLEGEFLESLDKLKKFFGSKNSINTIRNQFAFHYSPEEMNRELPEIDDDLFIYLEPDRAPNNLYYFAELISANALLSVIEKLDPHDTYKELVDELFDVSVWFAILAEGLMVSIIDLYYEDSREGVFEEIEIEDLQHISNMYIPWFSETLDLTHNNSVSS